MFGPVVGTSAGTVGTAGVVGVVATLELTGALLVAAEVVAVAVADVLDVGGLEGGELVHAAPRAATSMHAAIARIRRTV